MSHLSRIDRRQFVGTLAATLAAPALAQSGYPSRPIELIVPAGAGGGTDVLARAFADAARKHLPQPVTVVNRPGASGMIGHGEMINAKPDGYKLAMVFAEIVIVPHLGLSKLSYEDFTPIALLNRDPAAITVKADAPWNTFEEFIAASKAKSGELRMGNSGPGSIWHLAHAALEDKLAFKYNMLPFGGAVRRRRCCRCRAATSTRWRRAPAKWPRTWPAANRRPWPCLRTSESRASTTCRP